MVRHDSTIVPSPSEKLLPAGVPLSYRPSEQHGYEAGKRSGHGLGSAGYDLSVKDFNVSTLEKIIAAKLAQADDVHVDLTFLCIAAVSARLDVRRY